MLKVKGVKPSHREKKRYIVYEAKSTAPMQQVQTQLVTKLQEMLGIFMSSQAGIVPVTTNTKEKRGILRVNHTAVDYIKSCFVLMNELENKSVRVQSLFVSGMLNKAKTAMNS